MLVDFNLTVSNLTLISLPETNLQIQAAPRKEVVICFFYGHIIFIVLKVLNLFWSVAFVVRKV